MKLGYEIGIDVQMQWRCMQCGQRQAMDTPDGNEEWKFHCDKPMRLQPTWQMFAMRIDAAGGEDKR
jgi:hypothetical protein